MAAYLTKRITVLSLACLELIYLLNKLDERFSSKYTHKYSKKNISATEKTLCMLITIHCIVMFLLR